ncbi:hypothetical protein JY651_05030 [Pyxidicoccus parkwayensis]|uniref:Uncharacterized protein n=1 Tax=Pyxidicoccus parkwayensis TaxID=2813578 RepID=A0ABX7P217_9BACT|nr:hypothetical protein [Pyxidicoccus parkwaysis]QSQ24331.1 hypothetical protein JY651_05030 [Pyxidicoccus parkwaysis]
MKSFLKWGISAVFATIAAPALAHEDATGTPAELAQLAGIESARAACYIDTTSWDAATPDYCSAIVWWQRQATAVFSVIGLDQASGRYQITYLDNKCSRVWYTTQEGWLCSRTIGPFRDYTQRVQVTDLQTGQSVILSAIAQYETGA